jgi:hypothetical protein
MYSLVVQPSSLRWLRTPLRFVHPLLSYMHRLDLVLQALFQLSTFIILLRQLRPISTSHSSNSRSSQRLLSLSTPTFTPWVLLRPQPLSKLSHNPNSRTSAWSSRCQRSWASRVDPNRPSRVIPSLISTISSSRRSRSHLKDNEQEEEERK